MADEQNKSGKSAPNTVADWVDESSLMREFERIYKSEVEPRSQKYNSLQSNLKSDRSELARLLREGRKDPNIRQSPFYDEQVAGLRGAIASRQGAMNSLIESSVSRGSASAERRIYDQFSAGIQRDINIYSRSSGAQNQAFGYASMSEEDIHARRETLYSQIRSKERAAINLTPNLYAGGRQNLEVGQQIDELHTDARRLGKELASLGLAEKIRAQSGTSEGARFDHLLRMGHKAGGINSAADIAQELNTTGRIDIVRGGAGHSVKRDDIDREVINESRILAQALKDLSKAAEEGKDNLDELRSAAEQSAQNLDKLEKAQAGGGGGDRYGRGAAIAGAFAGGFGVVAAGAQQILVNQRMQQMSNIAGYAGLANQQYDMYAKARSGDIASQLALGQFGEAGNFGREMKNATTIVSGAQAAGAIAQTAAGGFKVASTLNPVENVLSTSQAMDRRIGGALDVAQGLTSTAVTASDVARGTSRRAAELAGIQAQMQARMAINAVGAQQAQGLRNFYTDLDVAAQGMGRGGSGFIQNATSDQNMQNMIAARMSPEQFSQMAAFGAQNIGSTFDSSQIFASRNLESRGFGSMQSNMQRMAALASAGSNNPQGSMENVLSAAVRAGLDSSKSIDLMVQNTASMVSSSAGAAVGIDTTNAASSLLASSMNPMMANKEFALQQAMSAQEITRQQTTNRDVSFVGMANTAGLQRALGAAGIGISGDEAIGLQDVDIATLKSLQNSPKKAAAFFQNRGVNVNEDNVGTALETTLKEKQIQLMRATTIGLGGNAGELAEKMRAGTLSQEEKRLIGRGATFSGRTGFEEFEREFRGVSAPNILPTEGQGLTTKPGDANDLKTQMDALRTSGFKQLSEAAAFASDNLKQFGGALKVFTDLQQKYEAGGKENEKDFSTAASKFAEKFEISTGRFDKSVSLFETTVKNLSNKAGLYSNGNPVVPTDLQDAMSSQSSSTRGATH